MNNSLIVKNENLIKEFDKNGMSSLIKPLNKKIYLSSPFVDIIEGAEGFAREGIEVELRLGDERFNENPVDVFDKSGKLLGEMTDMESEIYHNLLKGGKELYATVERVCIYEEGFSVMKIAVSLVEI